MEFNIKMRVNMRKAVRARMGAHHDATFANVSKSYSAGIWEAMELLNTLVDESDPDAC